MISLGEFILLSLIVVSAVLATVYLNRKLKEKGYKVNNLLNVLAVLAVSTALCLVGTSVAWILKGVAFALILLYASVEDFTKREADDCLWVMILLLCITNASGLSLWSMLGGGIIAFVELKRPGAKVKAGGLQEWWRQRLWELGFQYYEISDAEHAKSIANYLATASFIATIEERAD